MPGLGTIANAAAVLFGGTIGLFLKGGLKRRFQDTLMQALGLVVIFIGAAGTLKGVFVIAGNELTTTGTMKMIVSLLAGSIFGELMNIESQLDRFGGWLKKKFSSENDSAFTDGFIIASLTICVGAMAIVGSLEDGLNANASTLYAKAVLDGIIVLVLASSYGKGTLFSVIPLVLLQGSVTALASALKPVFTASMIADISYIGSMLIFCVGVNLMFHTKIKVANMLPSLVVVALCGIFPIG